MNSIFFKKYLAYFALFLVFFDGCCFSSTPPTVATPSPVQQQKKQKKQAPVCPMQWVLPGQAGYTGELPQIGGIPFEWTEHPDAVSYELIVTQPDGSKVPYKSNDVTLSLYMENFKQAGEYMVELVAFDINGQPLCSKTLTFTKPAVDSKPGKEDTGGSGNPLPPAVIIIPVEPLR